MEWTPSYAQLPTEGAADLDGAELIGHSRDGRPIHGYRFGSGSRRISLIAGCHADEPVGPRLLRRVIRWFRGLENGHPAMERFVWWIVPDLNPDGAARNRGWQEPAPSHDAGYDLATYLRDAVRELPGDDIEFGFPRDVEAKIDEDIDEGLDARPENRALDGWWASAGGPFDLHISFHGMAFAAGPWFLIDPDWIPRTEPLRRSCAAAVDALGYGLHDVEREGEKGFHRIERGFSTRPNSVAMAEYFLERDDPEMAARFRPSSMERIRSYGGDPLTLVSEMPLWITPGVGDRLGPPDPVAQRWRDQIAAWRLEVDERPNEVRAEAREAGLRSMPVGDQMRLQWALLWAGVRAVLPDGFDSEE